jgi:hypothetical protein
MKKVAFLAALLGLGAIVIAATCTIRGATVTVIGNDVWYSAEMEYDDGPNLLNHKFAVGFIKGQNAAASKTVDGCLRSLQSGNSNFFAANSGLEDDEVDTAVSRLVGPLTFGDTVNGDVSFSAIDATFNEDDETLIVNGRITNDDGDDLENLRVCVVVRNDNGAITIVDVDNNDYDLNPDDSADFSVDVDVTDDEDDVATVDLWVDGTNADEDDRVTDPQSDLDNDVDVCGTATATPTATNTPIATNTPGTPTATATATLPNAC